MSTVVSFADVVVLVVIRSYDSIVTGWQDKVQGHFLRV